MEGKHVPAAGRKEDLAVAGREVANSVYSRSSFCRKRTAALYETIIKASHENKRNAFIMVNLLKIFELLLSGRAAERNSRSIFFRSYADLFEHDTDLGNQQDCKEGQKHEKSDLNSS